MFCVSVFQGSLLVILTAAQNAIVKAILEFACL